MLPFSQKNLRYIANIAPLLETAHWTNIVLQMASGLNSLLRTNIQAPKFIFISSLTGRIIFRDVAVKLWGRILLLEELTVDKLELYCPSSWCDSAKNMLLFVSLHDCVNLTIAQLTGTISRSWCLNFTLLCVESIRRTFQGWTTFLAAIYMQLCHMILRIN